MADWETSLLEWLRAYMADQGMEEAVGDMAEVGAQSPEFHQDVERVLGAAIAAAEGGEPAAARVLHDAGFRLSSDPEVHDFLVRLRALYQAEHRRQSA